MNIIKKTIFYLYIIFLNYWKLSIGKGYLSRILGKYLGTASYKIDGIFLDLNPTSLYDQYLLQGIGLNPHLPSIMEEKLDHDTIFLDIGANIGFFSIIAEKKFGAQVFAFEPSPREFKRFKKNLISNDCKRIVSYNCALGNVNDESFLQTADYSNHGMNRIVPCGTKNSVRVKVKKLDSLIKTLDLEKIGLCKIDVEGFELEVLEGMSNIITKLETCKFIVEISPTYLCDNGRKAEDIYKFFEKYEYKYEFGIQSKFQWDEIFYK